MQCYWLRNLPFYRRLEGGASLDVFGEPVQLTRPPLRQFLNSEKSTDLAWLILGRALEKGAFPPYVSDTATVTLFGERREMTEVEKFRYHKAFGQELKQRIIDWGADLDAMNQEELKAWFKNSAWDNLRTRARRSALEP